MAATGELTLDNEVGLHARPAGRLVKQAGAYEASIIVSHGDRQADAKSLLAVLQLEAGHGATISIEADGPDEDEAVAVLLGMLRTDA